MATLAEVEVLIKANTDPLWRAFRETEKRAIELDRKLEKALAKAPVRAQSEFKKLNKILRSTGAIVGTISGSVAAGIFVRALTEFATFEQGMKNVQAVSGATADELKQLSAAALQAAATTRFNPKQSTEALYALASSGQNAQQQIASLPNVLDFAEAAAANLGQATEIVTSTLNVFGIEAAESARIADVFTASIGASALNADRIAVAMRNAGPTAAALGQSFEATTAGLAILTSAFGNGERAGTGLRAILVEMGDKAKDLGIKVKSSTGQFLPMVDVIRQIEERGITSTQIIETFGAEAGPALAALLSKGSKALEEMESRIQSTGQAAKTASAQLDTLSGDFAGLQSAISAALVKIGESQSGLTREALQSITNLVRYWSGYAETLGDARAATESLSSVIETLAQLLALRVAAGLISTVAATKALSVAATVLAGNIGVATIAARGLAGAMALIGGPAGAALLAAYAIYQFANSQSEADAKAAELDSSIRTLAGAMQQGQGASAAFRGELAAQAKQHLVTARATLANAQAQYELALAEKRKTEEFTKGREGVYGGVGNEFNRIATEEAERMRQQAELAADRVATIQSLLAELETTGTTASSPGAPAIPSPVKPPVIGSEKSKGGGAEAFGSSVAQIKERTAALIAETQAMEGLNPLVNDYGFALEKARAVQELLTAAEREKLPITADLKAQIDELATGYANASVEAQRLAESQDKVRERADEMREFGAGVFKGFINDLRAGKSGAEALAGALNKVADRILDVAINAMFQPMGGGGGGLFGSLLGGLGKLLGFSSGTANTGGRKGEPRGIVHGQEAVIPLPAGGKVPVDVRMPTTMTSPQIGGGTQKVDLSIQLETDSSAIAGIADMQIKNAAPDLIKISVQQSQKTVKANLPGMMSDAQSRNF